MDKGRFSKECDSSIFEVKVDPLKGNLFPMPSSIIFSDTLSPKQIERLILKRHGIRKSELFRVRVDNPEASRDYTDLIRIALADLECVPTDSIVDFVASQYGMKRQGANDYSRLDIGIDRNKYSDNLSQRSGILHSVPYWTFVAHYPELEQVFISLYKAVFPDERVVNFNRLFAQGAPVPNREWKISVPNFFKYALIRCEAKGLLSGEQLLEKLSISKHDRRYLSVRVSTVLSPEVRAKMGIAVKK